MDSWIVKARVDNVVGSKGYLSQDWKDERRGFTGADLDSAASSDEVSSAMV